MSWFQSRTTTALKKLTTVFSMLQVQKLWLQFWTKPSQKSQEMTTLSLLCRTRLRFSRRYVYTLKSPLSLTFNIHYPRGRSLGLTISQTLPLMSTPSLQTIMKEETRSFSSLVKELVTLNSLQSQTYIRHRSCPFQSRPDTEKVSWVMRRLARQWGMRLLQRQFITVWLVSMNIFSISRRVSDYQKESSSSQERESRKMERGSGCSSILKSLMNSYQWDWKKTGLGGYTLIYIIKLPLLSIHLHEALPPRLTPEFPQQLVIPRNSTRGRAWNSAFIFTVLNASQVAKGDFFNQWQAPSKPSFEEDPCSKATCFLRFSSSQALPLPHLQPPPWPTGPRRS